MPTKKSVTEPEAEVTEIEVPSVDESAYPERPYDQAADPAHLAYLDEHFPEQIGH